MFYQPISQLIPAARPRLAIRFAALTLTILVLSGVHAIAQPLFGTGVDGAWVVSNNIYLSNEMNFTNLTVDPGVTIYTNGHIIRVSGTLTNYGTITDSSSGGAGGPGGTGGAGGHISGVTLIPGATGGNGLPGLSGISGAGTGGSGGGGGGGGGPAQDVLVSNIADGGRGGDGGAGGKGGGYVRVYARTLDNLGLIHADGASGNTGDNGADGEKVHYYLPFNYFDMGGGGGGGGGGGNGGNGGTVLVVYDSLVSLGLLRANGGSYGSASAGGRRFVLAGTKSATATWTHGGDGGNEGWAGEGGGGLVGWAGVSAEYRGGTGEVGIIGANGVVSIFTSITCYSDIDEDNCGCPSDSAQFAGSCGAGYVALANDNCPLVYNPDQDDANGDGVGDACCCVGKTGNVNGSVIEAPDLTDLSMLIGYLTITPTPVLPCPLEANVSGTGTIDLTDLSMLIGYLTITPTPILPDCL